MILRCDLQAQYRRYRDEIDSAIRRVLRSGRYTLGSEVSSFETEFAAYVGCRYAVGVANATDGLILALKVFGVGAGDEVVTTPFTAIPTVSAIIATGATPVFVDIDPCTFLLDIDRVPKAITTRTKAVIPVHLFGNVVDVPRLRSLIPARVRIIEDAAQAHGSRIGGRAAGSFGDVGVFSFYPTKNLGGYGDGGAIVTSIAETAGGLRLLRMYGMTDKDHIELNGVNSRLDELQAAVLRVKLRHLDPMNAQRRRIAGRYKRDLDSRPIQFQEIPPNIESNFHVLAARVARNRDALVAYLGRRRIQTNVYYALPLHLQKANAFLGNRRGDFPTAEQTCREILALPMYPELSIRAVGKITATINRYWNATQS